MRNPFRKPSAPEPGRPVGVVRVDARTKKLTKHLRAGEFAVIDHSDLDRVAAESLVECRPAAVLNAAPSISGRYPNLGPDILVEAGIPLIDDLGPDIMRLKEGQRVVLDLVEDSPGRGSVRPVGSDEILAQGAVQTAASVAAAMEEAKAGLAVQLEAFAANTMEYMRGERDLLLNGVGMPDVRTDMNGRHVLVVVRGYSYKDDLRALKPYIREYKPA